MSDRQDGADGGTLRGIARETASEVARRLGRLSSLSRKDRARLARRLSAAIDASLDMPADLPDRIVARASLLRARHPGAGPVELAWDRIRRRARLTGAIGAGTTVPAVLPGVGPALGALGLVVDWRLVAQQQRDLVLEIAALLGVPLEDPAREVRALFVASAASAFGAATTGEATTRALSRRIARRSTSRLLPGAGAAVAGALNYVATVAIGRAALSRFADRAGIEIEGVIPRTIHPAMPWLRNAVVEAVRKHDLAGEAALLRDAPAIAELALPEREELLDLAVTTAVTSPGDGLDGVVGDVASILGFDADALEAARRRADREAETVRRRLAKLFGQARHASRDGARAIWRRASRLARRTARGHGRDGADESTPD